MRAQLLQVLAGPIADVKALDRRLDAFREPVEVVSVALAKIDDVERVLEGASIALSVAEVVLGAFQAEDNDDGNEGGTL